MVDWTNSARNDLRHIYDHIAEESNFYAKKVLTSIVAQVEILDKFPQMGRMVPEIMDTAIREIFVYSYRVIHESINNKVKILAVIHAKRDFYETVKDRLS